MKPDMQQCEHKWVHLRHVGTTEVGYRHWKNVDQYFCEKCLEQKTVESDIPEKKTYGSW